MECETIRGDRESAHIRSMTKYKFYRTSSTSSEARVSWSPNGTTWRARLSAVVTAERALRRVCAWREGEEENVCVRVCVGEGGTLEQPYRLPMAPRPTQRACTWMVSENSASPSASPTSMTRGQDLVLARGQEPALLL